MKQTYVKPHMIVERFSLTQSIASGCGSTTASSITSVGTPTMGDKYTCGWSIGGEVYFANAANCDDYQLAEDESIYGYCYNNPDGAMIFTSY